MPGQRRQKVLGYLKAANELRQSYTQSVTNKWQDNTYDEGMPGAFPDADIVRSGDEEMLLFPSYARPHTKATHPSQGMMTQRYMPGTREDISNPDAGDAEYWRREWEKYEDQNAIVDVDVRGWIYTPQRGRLNRRNRLLLAVARRLSGLSAPENSPSHSRESSQAPTWRSRVQDEMLSHEEEAAAREADIISRHGQKEAEAAGRGRYTADNDSLLDISPAESRSSSPTRSNSHRLDYDGGDNRSPTPPSKRQSWNLSTQMTRDEVVAANEQLMSRLRPFMTLPQANTPITIFFYNDQKSQSKSVYTDESGHFKVRAALDFVPTQVRVLASENLSVTEDVVVTESKGISIVSDIDDTIKHSAIASGAKEIFKNTFIRELGDLTVPGVKEWYSKMASMGVKMHYVSNSPWQLYPLLRSYFSLAGLPPGSFHLKQYSGMLQGIFEPAAERKKGSLDRIMHDFPERKFILIGDSGEADLEVYTDIVQEHPGRVLAVFIRDVTSKNDNNLKDFFYGTHPGDVSKPPEQRTMEMREERSDDGWVPRLPERPKPTKAASADLIDFSDDSLSHKGSGSTYATDMAQLQQNGKTPPQKPVKPSNLRSMSTMSPPQVSSHDNDRPAARKASDGSVQKTTPPPPPPAPRRTNTSASVASNASAATVNGERFYATQKMANPPPPSASRESRTLWQDSSHYGSRNPPSTNSDSQAGYLASARHQLTNVYNALPAIRPQTPGSTQRSLSSYPAAAARFVTGATGGDPYAGGDGGAPSQPYDRKLETWKRRWARSEDIMKRQGVVLKTWRNGTDVMGVCDRLVREEMRRMGIEIKSEGTTSR